MGRTLELLIAGGLVVLLILPANGQNERRRSEQRAREARPAARDQFKPVPRNVIFERDIAYRRGHELWTLDLAMPWEPTRQPRPAIVFIHGGAWKRGDKRTPSFANPTLWFASRGYVCINVNYRLGGPKADCIADVKCAVRWLRAHAKKYRVDPDRIGAFGNSAGAHLAVMLAVCPASAGLEGDGPWQEHSSMVQAVVAGATPTGAHLDPSAGDGTKFHPIHYVRADVPPMLLVHEASDPKVRVSNSDDFVRALREAGAKDISYLRLNDGSGHDAFQSNLKVTGPLRADFFNRTLRYR